MTEDRRYRCSRCGVVLVVPGELNLSETIDKLTDWDCSHGAVRHYCKPRSGPAAGPSWHAAELEAVPEGVKVESGEAVNHPQHYGGDTTYEVIKVLKAWGITDFNIGNTIKYLARAGKKGGEKKYLEDLKKGKFYLDDKVKDLETGVVITEGKLS
jgi:hypothetical protein